MTKEIPESFLKPYDPKTTEPGIYDAWEKSGYFNPDNLPGERNQTFSIIMPPPNANGSLHAGHALFATLEDIMIRFERMRGKKALWFPGADHAGFETQVVYEKKLQKEGRSRFDLSREDLYKEILDFTLSNKSHMEGQLRKLGASCDWTRQLFTLDDRVVRTVYETFKKLDDDGLLYRGLRSVNWCPKHQTAFSNLEIEYEERKEPFYYFQYGPFVIGTARPETKFGDKYVVMHPDDKRYAEYKHGDTLEVEWINGPITATIIKDEAGDPDMGSGVMTITPWHSVIDFDIAKKYDLEYEQIIDERGKLLPIAEEFEGMPIKEARAKIVEKLKEKGLLVKIDGEYEHSVPTCYKCSREIEPQLKDQWFIKMDSLGDSALKAIDEKKVVFVTERHEKIARHWLENIQDWNISRQIVWGIPIPAKLCTSCGHGMVDIENSVSACTKCEGPVVQDPDTFDTWFSSAQWPFITLDYPKGTDFKEYYPTSVMETAADILFFWVTRMLMMGLYVTGKVPFKTVYLHGLVNDAKGKKMSKSKGNVVDPIEMTDRHGTDALRMSLIVGNTPGTDSNFSEDRMRAYRKFANKIWNASRFVLSNLSDFDYKKPKLTKEHEANLQELEEIALEITKHMESYRFDFASDTAYHYFWHTFADVIIEENKEALSGDDTEAKRSAQWTLYTILTTSLKLLHPFMPFVTESVWSYLDKNTHKTQDLLMVEKWPVS